MRRAGSRTPLPTLKHCHCQFRSPGAAWGQGAIAAASSGSEHWASIESPAGKVGVFGRASVLAGGFLSALCWARGWGPGQRHTLGPVWKERAGWALQGRRAHPALVRGSRASLRDIGGCFRASWVTVMAVQAPSCLQALLQAWPPFEGGSQSAGPW